MGGRKATSAEGGGVPRAAVIAGGRRQDRAAEPTCARTWAAACPPISGGVDGRVGGNEGNDDGNDVGDSEGSSEGSGGTGSSADVSSWLVACRFARSRAQNAFTVMFSSSLLSSLTTARRRFRPLLISGRAGAGAGGSEGCSDDCGSDGCSDGDSEDRGGDCRSGTQSKSNSSSTGGSAVTVLREVAAGALVRTITRCVPGTPRWRKDPSTCGSGMRKGEPSRRAVCASRGPHRAA